MKGYCKWPRRPSRRRKVEVDRRGGVTTRRGGNGNGNGEFVNEDEGASGSCGGARARGRGRYAELGSMMPSRQAGIRARGL